MFTNGSIYKNQKTKLKYRFCDTGNITFFSCIGRIGAFLETDYVKKNLKDFIKL